MSAFFGLTLLISGPATLMPAIAGAEPTPTPGTATEAGTWSNARWDTKSALNGGDDAVGTVKLDWKAATEASAGQRFTLELPKALIAAPTLTPTSGYKSVPMATTASTPGATGSWSADGSLLTVALEQATTPEAPIGGTVTFDVTWADPGKLTEGEQKLTLRGPGFGGTNKAELTGVYVAPVVEVTPTPTTSPAPSQTTTATPTPSTGQSPSPTPTTTETPRDATSTPPTASTPAPADRDKKGSAEGSDDNQAGEESAAEDADPDPAGPVAEEGTTERKPVNPSGPSRDRPAVELTPEAPEAKLVGDALSAFSGFALFGAGMLPPLVATNVNPDIKVENIRMSSNYEGGELFVNWEAKVEADWITSFEGERATAGDQFYLGIPDPPFELIMGAILTHELWGEDNISWGTCNWGDLEGVGQAVLCTLNDRIDERNEHGQYVWYDLQGTLFEWLKVTQSWEEGPKFNLNGEITVPDLPTPIVPVADLEWSKVDGATGDLLAGSEWKLLTRSSTGAVSEMPAPHDQVVVDCVTPGACTGLDQNPEAGKFLVKGVPFPPEGQRYALQEVTAPEGYESTQANGIYTPDVDMSGVKPSPTPVLNLGELKNSKKPGRVEWSKIDADGGALLPGSEWQIQAVDAADQAITSGAQGHYDKKVRDNGTTTSGGFTPDLNSAHGEFEVELPAGRYALTETKAPADYELNEGRVFFDVGAGMRAELEPIGNTAKPRVGSLEWEKYVSTANSATQRRPLGGSEWELVQVKGAVDRTVIGAPMTVQDCIEGTCAGEDRDPRPGYFLVEGLPEGHYRLTETKAPDGYFIQNTYYNVGELVKYVEVKAFEKTTGYRRSNVPYMNVSWKKVDSETGEALGGSKWRLHFYKNGAVDAAGQPKLYTPSANSVGGWITDCVADSPSGCVDPRGDHDPGLGEFLVERIAHNEYDGYDGIVLTEDPPPGYESEFYNNRTYHPFDAPFASLTPGGTIELGEIGNVRSSYVAWSKVDDGGSLLAESEWKVRGVDADGNLIPYSVPLVSPGYANYFVIDNQDRSLSYADPDTGAYIPNRPDLNPADGKFRISLPVGRYMLTESYAPEGYTPDETPIFFEVGAPGSEIDLGDIVNYKKGEGPGSLSWSKVAKGSQSLLGGSEWELTPVNSSNQPTGDAVEVTDCVAGSAAGCADSADVDHREGELRVTGLTKGRYRLVETKAPVGFVLDDTPRYIEVDGQSTSAGAIENEQRTGLVIPLTGGTGALMFLVGGVTLLGLVVALLFGRSWWLRRADGGL